MPLQDTIREIIDSARSLQDSFSAEMISQIARAVELIVEAYGNKRKVIFMGNGGSAADAQHLAGELVGRFFKERRALEAIALNCNSSIITAVGNDYGYENVFSRQVEALAKPEDVLVGISTSGNSENVLRALEVARKKGTKTIGLLGKGGGPMKDQVDIPIIVPSNDTGRIQEVHITIGHIICEILDEEF